MKPKSGRAACAVPSATSVLDVHHAKPHATDGRKQKRVAQVISPLDRGSIPTCS